MLVGTTVLYKLSASDVDQINRRRTTASSIHNRLRRNPPEWPEGAMAHVGDPALEGELLPMIVTRATDDGMLISGHVLLNGSDTYWVAACQVAHDRAAVGGEAITIEDQVGVAALTASGGGRPGRGR